MGRIGITYPDVSSAIVQLQAQGKPPTVDNVRAVLGTGSKSTIARLLREWKYQHGVLNHNNGSLPNELLVIVKDFWLKQTRTDNTIDNLQPERDLVLDEMQQQLNQYKAKDAALWNRVQDLEKKLQLQNEDNKQLNAALIAEQQEKLEVTEQLQMLQSRQLESAVENEHLHQLLKQVQTNLEHYQATAQQLRLDHETIIEQQRADYEQKLLQLRQQAELVTHERALLETHCVNLDKQYDLLLTQHAALESQTEELQKKHSKVELDCARISENYARMSQNINVLRQTLDIKKNELSECQLRLRLAEEHVDYLQNTLFALEDKLIALQDDYLFVSQERTKLVEQVRQSRGKLETRAL